MPDPEVQPKQRRPRISVVLPTFNHASSLPRAIGSILSQSEISFEVIVVDDGSHDDPEAVVRDLGDPRVRYIRQLHSGVSAARNLGARNADADVITFIDGDDVAEPGWLAAFTNTAGSPPDVAICGARSIDASGTERWRWVPPSAPTLQPSFLGRFLPGHFAVAKALFLEIGGYDEELSFGENTELALRLIPPVLESGRFQVFPRVLITRRWSSHSHRYHDARLASAERVLTTHPNLPSVSPTLASSYNAILGVAAARRGDRQAARRYFWASYRLAPARLRAAGRLLIGTNPAAVRAIWGDGKRHWIVLCPGAGRVQRGYETFATELTGLLQDTPGVSVRLLQGGASIQPWVKRVRCLHRDQKPTQWLSRLGPLRPTSIEHYSFAIAGLVQLLALRPHVVLVSERPLANALWWIRRTFRLDYAIVFHNGGSAKAPFDKFEVVQQTLPEHYRAALDAGEPPWRHVLLPEGITLPGHCAIDFTPQRDRRRAQLDLPADGPILVSVGLVDHTVKRMDHLVRELALARSAPYLLILGEHSEETPHIAALAERLLGAANFAIRTVDPADVMGYLACADVFAMASLREGFGRAYLEALAAGLPTLVHDCDRTRSILGDYAIYVDMERPGSLAGAIDALLARVDVANRDGDLSRNYVARYYSWGALLPRYVDLFDRALDNRTRRHHPGSDRGGRQQRDLGRKARGLAQK